jgi:Gas vesicle synthesis protein GvpO
MAESTKGRSESRPKDEGDDRTKDEKVESAKRDGGAAGSSADRSGGEAALSAKELTEAAKAAAEDLTGYTPEAVTGLQWDGESWLVTVDVLELSRIPNTTDLLATYVVQLDDTGALLGYKRTRRFLRGQADGE